MQAELHNISSEVDEPNISELCALATRGLVSMFDPVHGLFCHRLVRARQGLIRVGLSERYTIMTLLGLRKYEQAGGKSLFDTEAMYRAFIVNTRWIKSIGDFGLLMWLTATFDPQQLAIRFPPRSLNDALDRYSDARRGATMELSWFLAGLAHAGLACPSLIPQLRDTVESVYHRLEQNQGDSGLFGHLSANGSVAGVIRGRIGSFADQIYPVYALSKLAQSFDVREPLQKARKCASALCETQGSLGQWWWLYESRTGKVMSRYPAYSVHQHGMAPMGLLALQEVSGQSFKEHIDKGLAWIYGKNELQTDLRDHSQNVIWRCIRHKKGRQKFVIMFRNSIGLPSENSSIQDLEILFEDWPYELGWLLYAFAEGCANRSEPCL